MNAEWSAKTPEDCYDNYNLLEVTACGLYACTQQTVNNTTMLRPGA